MKRLAALAVVGAVSAVGAMAGAIYVGSRLAEPTVVPDPYEAGLHYDDSRRAGGQAAGAPRLDPDHAHDVAAVGPRAPPRCELSSGPCAQRVGSAVVTLEASPRPVRAMAELELTVAVAPPGAAGSGPARLALTMPGMTMGENRVALAPAGEGRWSGRGVVVRCPSGRRTWAAAVELPPAAPGGEPLRGTFTFEVVDR